MKNNVTHPSPQDLAAFANGVLSPKQASAVQSHLDTCSDCRDVLGQEAKSLQSAPTTKPADTCFWQPEPQSSPGMPVALANQQRYRVLKTLGAGGMGEVYLAEHVFMKRKVALKVIGRGTFQSRDVLERFEREVQAAARLDHPNIVRAYDAEQADDTHFLVMEYIEGSSLSDVIKTEGPLDVAQACEYVRLAALGLQHANERGMVHRDIKPQNLMVTPDGQVKILDFGLARFFSETHSSDALTQTGITMGTPDFMSPEQASDAHKADTRADIYSLGCTLYYLLAGHVPFPGGGTVQKLTAHAMKSPRKLSEIRPDVPAEVQAIVARMMAKKPRNRYQTPAEVARALKEFLDDEVIDLVAADESDYVELVEEPVPTEKALPVEIIKAEASPRPTASSGRTVACPRCKEKSHILYSDFGRRVRCPFCKTFFRVRDKQKPDTVTRQARPTQEIHLPRRKRRRKSVFVTFFVLLLGGMIAVVVAWKGEELSGYVRRTLQKSRPEPQANKAEEMPVGGLKEVKAEPKPPVSVQAPNTSDKNKGVPAAGVDKKDVLRQLVSITGKEKEFSVSLSAGQTYVVTMQRSDSSKSEPFVTLWSPAGAFVATSGKAGGPMARFDYTAQQTGNYTLYANTLKPGQSGSFALVVTVK